MRILTVNADDFGFTRDVNAGIIEAHRNGILTSATLMANGDAFEDAVRLAGANPSLDIGVHLTLVGARSVADPGRILPQTTGQLIGTLLGGGLDVERELEAQIQKILSAGIRPTHLDTHKHTHLLPPVLRAVARLAQRYRILWVRRPFDLPWEGEGIPWTRRLVSRAMGLLRRRFHGVLERHGCRTTDHFAGFLLTGLYGPGDLARLIRRLPEGWTEFMCHPGFCTHELRQARTRLKESRVRELEALTSPEVRAAVAEAGVRLAGFGPAADDFRAPS